MAEIPSLLRSVVERHSAEPAIVTSAGTLDWSEVGLRTAHLVSGFGQLGIGQQTRVALADENSVDYLLVLFALLESGAIACPISSRLPFEEKRKFLDALEAEHLDLATIDWTGLREHASRPLADTLDLDRIAAIVPTSGTSSAPKLAALAVGNMYYNALGSHENLPFGVGDRWLVSLPLYHVGGMALLYRALLHGGALVIGDRDESLLDTVRRLQITHLSVVPTQLYRMLEDPRGLAETKSYLKVILVGGGPTPPALIDRALEFGLSIRTSYGLTEMGSQVTTTSANDSARALFTSGKILKHREIRISADGEILVRGETRFVGYISGDELLRPFDSDGWFATGDIGSTDASGYLTIRGRKDNMFVSGGENIHPEEIESALCRMPQIREAVVVAIDDDEFGHRPVGFVRLDETAPFDEHKLVRFLERFLPRFKIPDEFFPWPDDAPVDRLKPDRRWFAKRAVDILNR